MQSTRVAAHTIATAALQELLDGEEMMRRGRAAPNRGRGGLPVFAKPGSFSGHL